MTGSVNVRPARGARSAEEAAATNRGTVLCGDGGRPSEGDGGVPSLRAVHAATHPAGNDSAGADIRLLSVSTTS